MPEEENDKREPGSSDMSDGSEEKKSPREGRKRYKDVRITVAYMVAFAALLYPLVFAWIWANKLKTDAELEHQRIALEEKRLDQAKLYPGQQPGIPDNRKNSATPSNEPQDSAEILKNFVASGRTPAQPAPIQSLLGLMDDLVKAGSIPVTAASDLRKAIQDNTIEGTKEITVDFAKALIDRYIKPHEPSGTVGEAHPGTITQTNNNYCEVVEAPVAAPVRRLPMPPVKRNPKAGACGKS